MLVYSGSEIIEVRPQEIISSKVELTNSYLKLIPKVNKPKKAKVTSKPKPKKQDKGLIYLKVRIGKVDIVKLDLFKK